LCDAAIVLASTMPDAKVNHLVVNVRPVRPSDAEAWERLRCELWPEGSAEHAREIASFFAGTLDEPSAVMMAEDSVGKLVGFAELSIRTELPPLQGSHVGYVEGLYVVPDARGCGAARSLLRVSRDWARQQKCTAFASDRAGRVVLDRRFP
jgi:aminoglycoside 6'-N-acetyltransferase I